MRFFLLFLIGFASLSAATRAVVFDFGGVMANPDREPIVAFFEETFGKFSGEEYRRIDQEKREAFARGCSEKDFWNCLAAKKGIVLGQSGGRNMPL